MTYDISKTFIALKNLNFNCLGFLEIYTLSLSLSLSLSLFLYLFEGDHALSYQTHSLYLRGKGTNRTTRQSGENLEYDI